MSRVLPLAAESDLGLGVADDSSSRVKRNETMWLGFAPTGDLVTVAANRGAESVGAWCWSNCGSDARSCCLCLLDARSGAASKGLLTDPGVETGLRG